MNIEIGSHNAQDFLDEIDKCGYSRGLAKRDYSQFPQGCHAGVQPFPKEWLLSASDQQTRLADQITNRSSLYDIRMANFDTLKSLDQNGLGLCWAFSSTKATMYSRYLAGLPGEVLSAWFVAGKVKGWRDEGGWGAESASYIANNGVPLMSKCPGYKSSYDTSDTEADAQNHKILEFYEGSDDPNENAQIMISALLQGMVCVGDYNWLSHSMCICRVVSLNPLVTDDDNSWNTIDQYGEKGLYRITGSHARPDNVVIVRVSTASAA